jgi:hypothetical protein
VLRSVAGSSAERFIFGLFPSVFAFPSRKCGKGVRGALSKKLGVLSALWFAGVMVGIGRSISGA